MAGYSTAFKSGLIFGDNYPYKNNMGGIYDQSGHLLMAPDGLEPNPKMI